MKSMISAIILMAVTIFELINSVILFFFRMFSNLFSIFNYGVVLEFLKNTTHVNVVSGQHVNGECGICLTTPKLMKKLSAAPN